MKKSLTYNLSYAFCMITGINHSIMDILINNAGVAIIKSLVKTTDHEYDTVMDTNLNGVFFCCKSILPHMIKQKSGMIQPEEVTQKVLQLVKDKFRMGTLVDIR